MLRPSSPLRISCCISIVVRVLFLIGLLINLLSPNGGTVRAQASPQIRENRIEVLLPRAIRFHLDLSSDVPLQKISLIYGTNAKNCLAGSVRREMDFQAGSNVKLEWDWNFYQSGSVPPGAEIWWQWELRDRNGAVTQTEKQAQRVEDSQYAWKNIRQGNISQNTS